ncbi:MAG: carboxypeptidase regulatory-like domain-containing protein [Bryobacterales bacterium]|nr:carboxypeptidase regulatory-like domain-containing protein [Bryobacterales bacterium]
MMRFSCARFLAFFGAVAAYGQTITGSLSGSVLDPQSAPIQGATVTITETSRNFTAVTKTGAEGNFLSAGLLPGNYSVTVEATGFKKLSRSGIPLDANDKLDIGNLQVEVGAVTETVEVTGEAALLQTESVERSATITGHQIENIEVNGRNPLDLAKLIPGVVSTANFSLAGIGGLNNLNVNGERGSQNQLTINGIGAVDTGNNGQQSAVLSMDSISEFKMLTGTYQAEYGRSMGGQVALVTKTGGEQFHGSGYWYHRNESLNANTFLNNVRGLPKPLFRYNDPGYTIGGPIFIPKIFERARHKAFFFWSEEFQRQLSPNTPKNVLVPTALERQGDFSQSLDNTGRKLTFINDPLTQKPFPNMQIPKSRIYAPGQAVLNLYPLPNTTQVSNFNYTSQLPGEAPRREDLLRLDYNATDRVHLFGHWINDQQPNVTPYGSFVLGLNVPLAQVSNPQPGRSVAGGATLILSPTMTNEINVGSSHNANNIDEATNVLRRSTTGINLPVLYPNAPQNDFLPSVTFNGTRITAGPTIGTSNAPFHAINTTVDITDNLTKVSGSHTIKAGVYLQRSTKDQSSFGAFNGSYNFGDNPSNPYDTGFGFSNALLGVFNTFSQASNYISGLYRYWNVEAFVQDTWKIRRNLTLDYGLRAAWYQPQYDTTLQAATFVPALYDPAKAPRLYQPAVDPANGQRAAYDPVTNTYLPSFDIGLEIPHTGDPFNGVCQAGTCVDKYLFRSLHPQWGPRFGIAWDVTEKGKIVIRTGGGIYYDRIQGNRIFDSVTNPPRAVTPTLQQNLVASVDPKNILLAPPALVMADPTGKIPTTYQYQLGIQYRLPWRMSLDTAYVGTQARHLQDNRNLNYNPFGQCFLPQNQDPQRVASSPTALLGNNCKDANFLKPYVGFGNINLYESASTSNYNSLQINLQRRVTSGLYLGLAYTWSKSLGVAGNGIASTNDNSFVRPDQYTRMAYYGPTAFDRRHVLAINYVYDTPKLAWGNTLTRLATDGWQISGVTQALSGTPFNPGFSVQGAANQNITGSNTEGARIGVVNGCDPYTHLDDPFNRLNAACFFAPQPGSLGLESGINYMYGPGVINFDMALQKQFAVRERVRLQFRIDAFNVFNHANFTGYNSTLNFNSYPQSNGIVTGPPTLTPNALGRNPNGTFNVTGFGTVTQPAPGALGYSRILQTLIRVQF